eukprot:364192-Rhodomonas_salina.3
MPRTDIPHDAACPRACYATCRPDIARSPLSAYAHVRYWHDIILLTLYTMPGTDQISLRTCYAKSGTDVA